MKVGVLSFAHVHAAGYARLLRGMPGVDLLTADPDTDLAGPEETRGRALADELGVRYADSYEELFAWGPDVVLVTAENVRHRALVDRAAAHGADVLCEKPLATTEEDGAAMVAACREAGVRLGVAYPVRFSPAYAALRTAVRSGRAGRVLTVAGANNGSMPGAARAWFTDPEAAGGGALMDHTVHIADLLDDLFDGARAVEVYAQTNNLLYAGSVAADTAGLVTIRYDNDAVATIDCSWSQPRHHPRWGGLEVSLVGERGTLEMDAFGQYVTAFSEPERAGAVLPWGADLDAALLRAFLFGEGADDPDAVHVADGEAALRSLRIALAGYASARSGRPVPLA